MNLGHFYWTNIVQSGKNKYSVLGTSTKQNKKLWNFWPMLGVGWLGVVGIGIFGNHKELLIKKVVDWQQMYYTYIWWNWFNTKHVLTLD